jgi:hypothetical protein
VLLVDVGERRAVARPEAVQKRGGIHDSL